MSSQNSYVEILTLSVIILGDGAFASQLGHKGGALLNRISVLIRREQVSPCPHVCVCVCVCIHIIYASYTYHICIIYTHHIYVYIYIHVCMYVCVYYIYTHTYIYTSYKEKAVTYKPERESSLRTEPRWCPNLGLPVSRTMKKCLLFQPPFL